MAGASGRTSLEGAVVMLGGVGNARLANFENILNELVMNSRSFMAMLEQVEPPNGKAGRLAKGHETLDPEDSDAMSDSD